jgi:bifunctional non-homologous end joining protein LigD
LCTEATDVSDVRVGRRRIKVSNEDKIFFPNEGLTKGDLIDYYSDVGGVMLSHIKGHPLSIKRFPDGIQGESFFQKNTPRHFPDWIPRVEVAKKGGSIDQVVVRDGGATLGYVANQGGIEMHTSLSREDALDRPDRLIFDLDPWGDDFAIVRDAARLVREVLDGLGLPAFLQTSGSRGLHVVTPLRREETFDEVKPFARDVSTVIASRDPKRLTVEMRKEKRKHRLLIDYFRNAYAQTSVAPYSVRALPGAPVATPLDWDELEERKLGPQRYNIDSVRKRLARRGDPWKGMSRRAHGLAPARRKLDRLLEALGA